MLLLSDDRGEAIRVVDNWLLIILQQAQTIRDNRQRQLYLEQPFGLDSLHPHQQIIVSIEQLYCLGLRLPTAQGPAFSGYLWPKQSMGFSQLAVADGFQCSS